MMKGMNLVNWFKSLMIRNKIIIIFIPLIIIPLFLLGFISNRIFTQAVIHKTVINIMDESKLIIMRLNVMLENSESCANIIMSEINKIIELNDKNVQLSRVDRSSQVTYLSFREQIENQLKFAKIAFPDIASIVFIDTNLNVYNSDANMENDIKKVAGQAIIDAIDRTNGRNQWFPMQKRDYFVSDKSKPVLTLGKKVLNINTQDKLGTLIININENSLESVYHTIDQVGPTGYFLLDSQGNIVSSLSKETVLKPMQDEETKNWLLSTDTVAEVRVIDGKKVLITSMLLQKTGWRLVNEIPLERLTADVDRMTTLIIMIGCVCLFIAVLGVGILTRAIVNPLTRLTKSMLKIREGNLEVQCQVESPDEVGLLASGFNTMVGEIRDLLSRMKQEQRKKREYELALIQSQIKPHFLYNTLDVIYALAKMERLDEVRTATKSLADFYKAALSKGREIISIGEEIRNVKDYLSIQRIRYSDVFNYEISVQEDILRYDILKLTIQPLVENSIYHGLKAKATPGKIAIEGYKEQNRIIIKVIDDGVGIPAGKLAGLLQSKGNISDNTRSFGINNVDERIKLYFGEDYGIDIESREGAGTEVTLKLPV